MGFAVIVTLVFLKSLLDVFNGTLILLIDLVDKCRDFLFCARRSDWNSDLQIMIVVVVAAMEDFNGGTPDRLAVHSVMCDEGKVDVPVQLR